ncbi:hypothetical protein LA080_000825 [Diaporthe eres]|nr:hypothetical protein LA080_000825 [Diaporthe eres]
MEDPVTGQDLSCSYEYGPLDPHQIRLLRVKESKYLELSIEVVNLASNPEYVALSYAWEGQMPRHRIACGSSSHILVTDSVLSMLNFWHAARDEDGLLPIWIDAVCINQSDTSEKSIQVQLMSRIYTQARQVSQQFARACIDVYGPGTILYHCLATDPVPGCPSWVPNRAATMSLEWFKNSPAFRASTAPEVRHSMLQAEDGQILVLHGYIVDEIKCVGPSCMPWATTIDPDWEANTREIRDSDPDWAFDNLEALFHVTMPEEMSDAILKFEEECLALARSAYGDQEAALKAHFATLTAELPNTHPGMPPWTVETYQSWKRHFLHRDPCKADVLEYWRRGGNRTAIVNLMLMCME